MHQIKLLSMGSLFLHFLHIYTIKYFNKKWNLLDHLMVISNRGGPTSDLINLQLPDSCLATKETSALCGTKPLASASDSQWKTLECESMVPVNTQQSSWWGGQLMWARRWIGAWGTAPVAAWEGVRLHVGKQWRHPPTGRKKYEAKIPEDLMTAQPLTPQKSLRLRNLHRVLTEVRVWSQWKRPNVTVAQPDQQGQCQVHSCTSLCEKFRNGSQSPRWIHFHCGSLLRAQLLFCWDEREDLN